MYWILSLSKRTVHHVVHAVPSARGAVQSLGILFSSRTRLGNLARRVPSPEGPEVLRR